ncbi:MAG: CxxxxCH/CxxCH domain-containing protein [Deltaproteobacteria bacterium]|nr:CxxxxCH/CxxCH domain-containing protein [Deltaproteobacteria bacterium]
MQLFREKYRSHQDFAGSVLAQSRAVRLAQRCVLGTLLVVLGGCTIEREQTTPAGSVHPVGWVDAENVSFHGKWLRDNKHPLERCRACHGDDYEGGAVSVGCNGSKCHAQPQGQLQGPESCSTCHGDEKGPLPETGAHAKHGAYCDTCHVVPKSARDQGHLDGDALAEVRFSGLALVDEQGPSWERSTGECSNTYCHGKTSPKWPSPSQGPLACDSCHGSPPGSHVQWGRVAQADRCGDCHPVPPGASHLDGKKSFTPDRCDACHGGGGVAAPPMALDGSESPEKRGVGAHRRHVDATLADRMGAPVSCVTCHPVPLATTDPGHLDREAPADVRFQDGGRYDQATGSCVAWCHFDRDPGPSWTDTSGAARACNACHGFPPDRTRRGTWHINAAPQVETCRQCHVFEPMTHVNGTVDYQP